MTDDRTWTTYESPVGRLALAAGARGLTHLRFAEGQAVPEAEETRPMPDVTEQLDAYFAGELRAFEVPLDMRGTELQMAVWAELLKIPYGTTASYGEIAARLDPGSFRTGVEPWQRARAVGAANGRNPVAIIVPCHRVIGADGSLTGYAGGLERKRALLELEGARLRGPREPHAAQLAPGLAS